MAHKPPSGLGTLFGVLVLLTLALLDCGLVVIVFTSPITLLTVLRALVVILSLPVMGMVVYGLSGLRGASYSIDRNAIVIRWGGTAQVIPLPNVEEILRGGDLGRISRFRGLRWPGYWTGRGRVGGVGSVRFYCTTSARRHLVIRTKSGTFAISPQDPDRFVDLFASQQEMGISEVVEQTLVQPGISHRGLLSDRSAGLLLGLGAILNLLLYAILAAQYGRLPHTLPLHFDAVGLPDRVGGPSQLFVLIALGTSAWLVNGVLGAAIHRWLGERMAAYLLWGAAAGLQVLLWVAITNLI